MTRSPRSPRRLLAGLVVGGLAAASLTGVLVAAPVATAPAAATPNYTCTSGQGYGYFVNAGSGSVSIVYTGTNTVVGTVATGGTPYGVGVTPDGKQVYVAGAGTSGVSVFNTTNFTPRAVPGTFRNAVGAVPSADGTKMFISNIGSNYISVIDTATNTVSGTVTLPGNGPGWMDIDPTTGLLWVAAANSAYAINTTTNTLVRTVTTGTDTHGVTVGGGYVWAVTQSDGIVRRYSATTGAAAGTLNLNSPHVHGIAYDPSSGYVIATLQDGTVRVVNGTAATMTQLRSFSAGTGQNSESGGARIPIVSPFGQIYVASAGTNTNAPGSLYTLNRNGTTNVTDWTISRTDALQNNPDGHTSAFSCMPPLSVDKTMSPAAIPLNGTGRVSLQINNTNFVDVTGVAVEDDLPDGMELAATPNTTTTCGGTLTTTADRKRVTLTGGTIKKTQIGGLTSCVVSFDVLGTSSGAKSNSIDAGALTADNVPPSTTATTARMTVQPGPSATADRYSTALDTTIIVAPLSNDTAGLDSDGTAGTFDSATVVITNAGATDGGKTLVVDGEGTWTVGADGRFTFDPLPDFSGTATPVDYAVRDNHGNQTGSTVSMTVRERPVANPDTATTPYNTPVSVTPSDNDAAGGGQTFDPTTVRLIDPATGDPATTVTIDDEGTYTVDVTTGEVEFTPVKSFTGTATPIGYTMATEAGDVARSTITVTVSDPPAPTATDDTSTAPSGQDVTFTPLSNDDSGPDGTSFVTSSLRLVDPDTGDRVTTVTVPDEGTWTVDTATGVVTFEPESGFSGIATPIDYTALTNTGARVTGTMTPTIGAPPTATPDTGTADFNEPVTVDVATNDTPGADATIDATTVRLRNTAGAPVTTLEVPDKGTWTVDPTTGAITFTPIGGFSGTVEAPYQVADSNGTIAASTVSVTVNPPPTAKRDTATTPQDETVTVNVLRNDNGYDAGLDPASVRLVNPDGDLVTTLTVPDEGTYTVGDDGQVTFDPLPTFAGAATSITYSVADNNGNRGRAALVVTVAAAPAPTATDDTATTQYNTPVTVSPLTNDSAGTDATDFDPASVRLVDPDTGNPVMSLTVDGEGMYTVAEDGSVRFTPVASFTGTATPVAYTASTTFGATVSANITVTVRSPSAPTATADSGTATYGNVVTLSPLSNDASGPDGTSFEPSTLRLIDPKTGKLATTVTVPGEGTWRVNTTTGRVTFTPVDGFSGVATRLDYTAETNTGVTARSSLTASIGPAPAVAPDAVMSKLDTPVTVDVLGNDSAPTGATLDRSSVRLLDGDGKPVTTLTVSGQGTFTVDTATGAVTFAPVSGFTGTVKAPYQVTDSNGATARSTVSVTIAGPPTAKPDTATTRQGTPVRVDPLGNDTTGGTGGALDPASVRLVDPRTGQSATTVTIDGQGTYTVGTDGSVTFTPLSTFHGTADPIGYTATDVDGTAIRSTITITVTERKPAARDDTATATAGSGPVVIDPLGNDRAGTGSLDPSSVRLIDPTSGALVTSVKVPGEGTYTVDTNTGKITFTPETGFTGTTSIRYSVADSSGSRTEARATVTIAPSTVSVTPNPGPGGGVVVTTPGGELAFTGATLWQGAAGGAGLLLAGLVLLIARRRRGIAE